MEAFCLTNFVDADIFVVSRHDTDLCDICMHCMSIRRGFFQVHNSVPLTHESFSLITDLLSPKRDVRDAKIRDIVALLGATGSKNVCFAKADISACVVLIPCFFLAAISAQIAFF